MAANNNQDPLDQLQKTLESFIPATVYSISGEVNRLTDAIEQQFETVAETLRSSMRGSEWIPDSVKPAAPPPSSHDLFAAAPTGYFAATKEWVSRHRMSTAPIAVAFVGTPAFLIWRGRRRAPGKRRAKRARNGARTEVVVVAGSPHSPLTRSLSHDLERRGFMVYIPVSDASEEHIVQAESRMDIRPLHLDITSVPYQPLLPSCNS